MPTPSRAAARAAPAEDAISVASPKAERDIVVLLETMFPDGEGGVDVKALLDRIEQHPDKVKVRELEMRFGLEVQRHLGDPVGTEMALAPWGHGLRGKVTVALTALGAAAVIVLLGEGIGYMGGWDWMRISNHIR